jgi:hypothetical protein
MTDSNEEPNLEEFMKKMFPGADNSAESFFQQLETDPTTEAWISFHTIFMGLRSAGFQLFEATDIMAGYLYRLGMGTMGPDGEPI